MSSPAYRDSHPPLLQRGVLAAQTGRNAFGPARTTHVPDTCLEALASREPHLPVGLDASVSGSFVVRRSIEIHRYSFRLFSGSCFLLFKPF